MNSESIDATLYRRCDVCYSSHEFRIQGELLRHCLARTDPNNPLSAGLLRASAIFLAEPGLRVLAACSVEALARDWITFPDPLGTTFHLYNVWSDMPPENRSRFLSILKSDAKLRGELRKIAPCLRIPRKMLALSFIGHCFESTFPPFGEPLLVSIVLGTSTVNHPVHIDLSLSRGWISKRHRPQRSFAHEYAVYFEQLRKVTAAMRQGQLATLHFQITNDAWKKARPKEIKALKILEEYTQPRSIKGETFLRARSLVRYLQEVPSVFEMLSDPKIEVISHVQYATCQLIQSHGPNPEIVKDFLDRVIVIQTSAKVNLVSFDAARNLYGLSGSFPSLNDTADASLRVLTILLFCGRRVRCLTEVKVKDFYATIENGTEVFVPSSKVHSQRETWLPLAPILGNRDLSFLSSWIERMKSEGRGEAYLVDLALGERIAERLSSDEIQRKISLRLMESLDREAPVNTHDPRRVFASWFPIRCMLAEHRELIDHPLLIGHLQSDVFEDYALDRLQKVIDGGLEDPLMLCAKFMGNSHTYQLRKTYCRSWPILLALRAALERRRLCF